MLSNQLHSKSTRPGVLSEIACSQWLIENRDNRSLWRVYRGLALVGSCPCSGFCLWFVHRQGGGKTMTGDGCRSLKTERWRSSQLRAQAMHSRAEAMHSQLTAATNYVSVAENALIVGRVRLVHDAFEKAIYTVQKVREHLQEPNRVPPDSAPGIRDRIVDLQKQISGLETRLRS